MTDDVPRRTDDPARIAGILVELVRWACAAAIAVIVSGFAFLLVTGDYANAGPVVAKVSYQHGVHAGDLFVMAGWAVAMLALAVLVVPWRRFRRRPR